MNKPTHAGEPHDHAVSAIYAKLKTEQPSKDLDEAVLALAKQQLEQGVESSKNTPSKTRNTLAKSNWRRLQWPLSVAASVLLICVIFIGQYAFFTTEQDVYSGDIPYALAPQSDLVMPSNQETLVQTLKIQESANDLSTLGKPLRSAKIAPESEMIIVQGSKGARSEQLDKAESLYLKKQQALEQGLSKQNLPHNMAITAHQSLKNNSKDLQQVEQTLLQVQEQLEAKVSRLAALKQADTQNDAQSNVQVLPLLKQQDVQGDIGELQQQLLSIMQQKLALSPQWQIPEDMLNLLTAKQQAQWHNQSTKETKQ